MVKEVKVIEASDLKRLAAKGREFGYNRQLPKDFCDQLDPESTSVVTFSMLHEYIAGKPVRPHMRLLLITKLKDHEPQDAQIDVSAEDYDRLATTTIPG